MRNALRHTPQGDKSIYSFLEALDIRPVSVGINSDSISQNKALSNAIKYQKCHSVSENPQKEREKVVLMKNRNIKIRLGSESKARVEVSRLLQKVKNLFVRSVTTIKKNYSISTLL